MVKVRFNSLDVAASVTSLRLELRGMRLNNIYDIDNKVRRVLSLLCCVLT
jgi:predicted ribosome quality control (RQC) complex YloA/Tae2 family protein